MFREYEVTLIINAVLPEEECKKVCKKYEDILLAEGGEVIKKDAWGVRKLAFPINRQFRGYFVHYDLAALPANLAEAERLMRIDDNVLRYLSVRLGEGVDVEERKAELAKIEAKMKAALKREREAAAVE